MSTATLGVSSIPLNTGPREQLPIYKDARYIRLVKNYKCKSA